MEIDSNKFVKVMNKNFGYPIEETRLGKGIKVDATTAFIYSSVTGAGYLDDLLYPFTVKGLTKLFYNAFDYKFVTGLFDNTTLKNTPYILSKAKPFLFNSHKIIVPVEFKSEVELQKKLRRFVESVDEEPTNFLIQRIETSKRGNGMEPFMEYLACETLKNKDYIVENQIPLTHSTGSPDFEGYKVKFDSRNPFSKMHLIELSLLRLGLELKSSVISENEIIVGEVKTSTTYMKVQLEKYMKTGIFNKGYEIHPTKSKSLERSHGTIYINEKNEIRINEADQENSYLDLDKQKEYVDWMKNYMKFYLVANLTNDEFIKFYEKKTKRKISGRKDVVDFITALSIDEILKVISGVIKNGFI